MALEAAQDAPSLMQAAFVYLMAAVVSVPVARRLGLGSVIGYLIAGVIVGPFGLGFLGDPESVMHAAELGVVIMLFLIGLELQPAVLWRLRTAILGMGTLQVVLTGLVFAGIAMALGVAWQMALAIGFTLSMSSTAIVLQSLREKNILETDPGRSSFAVLLFQDLAFIPMLVLFPLLATLPLHGQGQSTSLIAAWPVWAQVLVAAAAVASIVLVGRLALRPVMRWIAKSGLHEMFTAFALVLVVGVTLLMQSVGLSPALGAFVAGVVLADSEFRHEIEMDIDPFRGLLLGLFFISVGASIDFGLIAAEPLMIVALVLGLLVVKTAVMVAIAAAFRHQFSESALIGLALAQGGEYAFVLFALAEQSGVLPESLTRPLIVAVAISMAFTPFMIALGDWLGRRHMAKKGEAERPHEIESTRPEAIVAGYGRYGQMVGRLLEGQGYRTSVLDHDADQVEVLRGFGRKVNYGDATRPDLLRIAGIEEARVLVIALDDKDKTLALARMARERWPHLKIAARAFDRRAAYDLMGEKVDVVERESFASGVRLGRRAMELLGADPMEAELAAEHFSRYDEKLLAEMYQHYVTQDTATYQRMVRDRTALEANLLRRERDDTDRLAAE